MKTENVTALERLGLFSHFGGLISVFVGLVVTLMDVLNGDFKHIQVGIYIFITGYAIFKIGAQITNIVNSEKR